MGIGFQGSCCGHGRRETSSWGSSRLISFAQPPSTDGRDCVKTRLLRKTLTTKTPKLQGRNQTLLGLDYSCLWVLVSSWLEFFRVTSLTAFTLTIHPGEPDRYLVLEHKDWLASG